MEDNFIHLKKSNVLKLGIKDNQGHETGEHLEFDLEDIELPLIYQQMIEDAKQSREQLKNKLYIIKKRKDVKGKKLMSKNEEDEIKALNEFYRKQEEIYNRFLGKDGVKKLLNGRKIGWTSLMDIDEIIQRDIAPKMDITLDNLTKKIKEKYNNSQKSEVLKANE